MTVDNSWFDEEYDKGWKETLIEGPQLLYISSVETAIWKDNEPKIIFYVEGAEKKNEGFSNRVVFTPSDSKSKVFLRDFCRALGVPVESMSIKEVPPWVEDNLVNKLWHGNVQRSKGKEGQLGKFINVYANSLAVDKTTTIEPLEKGDVPF